MDNINDPSSMPVDGEPAPHEVPPVSPLVPDPAVRSNYPDQRGSAAAVVTSTPAVATEKVKKDAPRPTKRRGASAGGKPDNRDRSRSDEEDVATSSRPGASLHLQLLQAQVVELNGRLITLEVAHASGQNAINGFADSASQSLTEMHNRSQASESQMAAHLAVIEEAFQRCDRAMQDLTVASQAAVSAAAHAATSTPGASPSSGLSPGLTRTDLNILRTQLDTVSAEQLAFGEQLTGVGDRFVAQEVSLQRAVAETRFRPLA